jgi:molecular chaperone GrpE
MNEPQEHSHDADGAPEVHDLPLDSAEQDAAGDSVQTRLQEAEERLLRAQAEVENVRKRGQRELQDLLRYGEINLLRDILPVLDNIERAIEASEKTADVESLRAGFRMTAQQIEKMLESHGCKTIETEAVAFDPAVHEAIAQQPAGDAAPGSVVGVASKGYVLHDRVVRPAQVIVAATAE